MSQSNDVYRLDRLRFLVVDDNQYIRKVMGEVLTILGAQEVLTSKSGVDAIELLKKQHQQYDQTVDIIVSDFLMAPVDGMLFLRWVRQGRDTPNRFTPFIMMSGAADQAVVSEARDMGANEFLAKPFSPATVTEKVLSVIDRPRQFVATPEYFGPDRKRHISPTIDDDRRNPDDHNATIIYSADKVVRPSNPQDVFYFRLENNLKEKVGGIGRNSIGSLPDELLAEADKALHRRSLEFHDWASGYLAKLSSLCALAHGQKEAERRKTFRTINLIAHELRGQGGTFGYPLITRAGKSLYEMSYAPDTIDDTTLVLAKAHIDTMFRVFKDRITGDGGDVGRQLILELEEKVERHRPKKMA